MEFHGKADHFVSPAAAPAFQLEQAAEYHSLFRIGGQQALLHHFYCCHPADFDPVGLGFKKFGGLRIFKAGQIGLVAAIAFGMAGGGLSQLQIHCVSPFD